MTADPRDGPPPAAETPLHGDQQAVAASGVPLPSLRVLQAEAPALFGDFEIYAAVDGAEAGRVGYHKV